MYTKAPDNPARRSAQAAIYKSTSALVRMPAPMLVFTGEEIWKYLPKSAGEASSVHVALFPEQSDLRTGISAAQIAAWDLLAKVPAEALQALEAPRHEKKSKSSLQAKVLLAPKPPLRT